MKLKKHSFLASLFFILYASTAISQYSNPVAPTMGTMGKWLLFTSAGAVTNAGTSSIYAGNVGTNLGAITGFETLQTQPFGLFHQTPETAIGMTDLAALQNDLNGRIADEETAGNYGAGITTLSPGIYNTGGAISVIGTLYLDGKNDPNARFIIRSGGAFTAGAGSKIILINGAQSQNVFWVITGAVAIAANVTAQGFFINAAAISLGANCTLEGGAMSTAGAITTLDGMSLSTPDMLLKENQSINNGATPADLVLIRNTNPIIKWQSAVDSNFTNPTDISHQLGTLSGFCIGPLSLTTYYRVVVLIDGTAVYSNAIKINIVVPPTMDGPLSSFALFTTAGAITNAGLTTNNAHIGTNAGAITGTFTNMSLLHVQDSLTIACANFLLPLFNSLKSIPTTGNHAAALGAGEILEPGVYQIASAATLGGLLTLDGKGLTNSVFIFKITGALAMAASTQIVLTNDANASNVFWVIDGALGVGATCNVKGNFICLAGAIALGNNTIAEGRFLTIAGAITSENVTLSMPITPIALSSQLICSGAQPNGLSLTGNVTTVVKWQKSSDIFFSIPIDIPNTTVSLSGPEIGNLTAPTYFRAVVTIGGQTLNSTTVTIAINQASIPGIISSNQEFCSANQPADLILVGNCGSVIKWQSSPIADFTTPTDIANTTNTLSGTAIGSLSVTTFYRAVVQNCTCCPIGYAAPAKISIAATTTWNGTSWSNGSPSSSKGVIFTGNFTTNADINACSVTIDNGAAVLIPSAFTMTVTNELTNRGSLTFQNNASLLQTNDNAINLGNITYNRQTAVVRSSDYSYWSSPLAEQILSVVFPTSPSGRFYSYDAFATPEDWKNVAPSTTTMAIGTGYILQGSQNNLPPNFFQASFFGKPNNGLQTITIGPLGTSNLIGNPYPSAIDANLFLNVNNTVLEGTLYFWTHNTVITNNTYTSNDYASWNSLGGVAATLGGVQPSGKIAAGQAFFVTSTATGSNAVFNNGMRVAGGVLGIDNSQFFKRSKTKTTDVIEKNRIWLDLSNTQGAFKQTLVGYVTGATNNYDNSFDGLSYDANKFVDFYSINQGKNLVIQGRTLPFDETDEVPLGYRSAIDGDFTIRIDQADGILADQGVFIEDKLNNTLFDLKSGDYTFTTIAGTFDNRFVLRYTNKTLGTTNFVAQENQVLVSKDNKQIKVNSFSHAINKVAVYDLSGKLIYQKTEVNSNELTIPNLLASHQVLLVKTVLQNGQTVNNKIIY